MKIVTMNVQSELLNFGTTWVYEQSTHACRAISLPVTDSYTELNPQCRVRVLTFIMIRPSRSMNDDDHATKPHRVRKIVRDLSWVYLMEANSRLTWLQWRRYSRRPWRRIRASRWDDPCCSPGRWRVCWESLAVCSSHQRPQSKPDRAAAAISAYVGGVGVLLFVSKMHRRMHQMEH